MNYLKYLRTVFDESIEITEEINYAYDGNGTAIVIKYLAGSNYLDSQIVPIQLAVYTNDMPATKLILDEFVKAFHDITFIQEFDYVRQFYSTPVVLNAFDDSGIGYTTQFIVSGTLVISSNVSDIKIVEIDGQVYQTTTRVLTYVAIADSKRSVGTLNQTNITNGMMKFNCAGINKGSELGEKVRNIRLGRLDLNTVFEIKLTFTDNDFVEPYTMKLDSGSFNSENQALPVLSLSFIQ